MKKMLYSKIRYHFYIKKREIYIPLNLNLETLVKKKNYLLVSFSFTIFITLNDPTGDDDDCDCDGDGDAGEGEGERMCDSWPYLSPGLQVLTFPHDHMITWFVREIW